MAEELIDRYIDRSKFKSDTDFATSQIQSLFKEYEKLSNTRVELAGATYFKDVAEGAKEAEAQLSGLNTKLSELAEQQKKVAQTAATSNTAAREYSTITKENTKSLNENVQARLKLQQANKVLSGDQKEAAELLRLNIIKQDEYNERVQKAGTATELNKRQIQELNKVIKDQSGEFAGTFGAYKQLSREYDNAATKAQDLAVALGSTHPESVAAAADAQSLADKLKAIDSTVGKFQRNVGNYSGALSNYANVLRNSGGIAKVFGSILGFSAQQVDDARIGLEHLLQVAASYFQTKEKGAKATAESAAAEAADVVAKEANVGTTTAATAANTTYATSISTNTKGLATQVVVAEATAVAQVEVAVATTAASTAMSVFTKILKFSGIGLIIGLLSAAAYGLYQIAKASGEAKRQQELLRDVVADAAKSVAAEVAKLDLLKDKLNNVNTPLKERTRLVKEYNETASEQNRIAKNEINNLDLINSKITKQIGLIEQRALATAFEKKITEAQEKIIDAQLDRQINAGKVQKEIIDAANGVKRANEKATIAFNSTKEASENFATSQSAQSQQRLIDANKEKSAADKRVLEAKKGLEDLKELANGLKIDFFLPGKGEAEKKAKTSADNSIQSLKDRVSTEFEIEKIALQRRLTIQKDAIDNDEIYYLERLNILDQFVKDSDNLNQKEVDNAVKNVKAKRDSEIDRLEEEKAGKTLKQKARINDNIKIINQNAQEEINLIVAQGEDKTTQIISDAAKTRVDIVAKHLDDQKKEYEDFKKAQQDVVDQTNDRFEKGLKKREAQEKEAAEKLLEVERQLQAAKVQLAEDAADLLFTLAGNTFENQKNKLQEEADGIDTAKARKIEAINAEAIAEEEKANKIAIIEAIAVSKHEAIVRKQKDIDVKKAQFDKLQQIFQIGIETAKTVASIQFAAAKLQAEAVGNPLLAALIPLVLRQIPTTIAGGALAIAAILGKAIPKYKHGRGKGKEELAWTGDGGISEIIQRADGRLEVTPAKDTLTYLGKDDIVHPSIDSFLRKTTSGLSRSEAKEKQFDFERIVKAVGGISVNTQVVTEGGHSWRNARLNNYNDWIKNIS